MTRNWLRSAVRSAASVRVVGLDAWWTVLLHCSTFAHPWARTSHVHVVVSFPFPLRFLLASQPAIMSKVLGIVYRTIATHLTHKAGYTKATRRAAEEGFL